MENNSMLCVVVFIEEGGLCVDWGYMCVWDCIFHLNCLGLIACFRCGWGMWMVHVGWTWGGQDGKRSSCTDVCSCCQLMPSTSASLKIWGARHSSMHKRDLNASNTEIFVFPTSIWRFADAHCVHERDMVGVCDNNHASGKELFCVVLNWGLAHRSGARALIVFSDR